MSETGHTLIVGAELHDPAELAALNPGVAPKQLARLQMLAQVLDEDDAATGYLEPGEDPGAFPATTEEK